MSEGMRKRISPSASGSFAFWIFCLTFAIATASDAALRAKERLDQNSATDLAEAPLPSRLNYRPPAKPKSDPPFPSVAPKPEVQTFASPPVPNKLKASPPPPSIERLRLLFLPESTEVLPASRPLLDDAVRLLQNQPDRRMQITAYAQGTPETASASRRLSLARALAIRSFLTGNGIRSAQVDIFARGFLTDLDLKDRVDLDLVQP